MRPEQPSGRASGWIRVPFSEGPVMSPDPDRYRRAPGARAVKLIAVLNLRDEPGLVGPRKVQFAGGHFHFTRGETLGILEDKPGAMLDPDGLGLLGDRVEDGCQGRNDRVANFHTAVEAVPIELEREELRFEYFRKGGGQDLERQTAGLAAHDGEQRLALGRRGFFIHKQANGAV